MPVRDPNAAELRAVAPLVTTSADGTSTLVGAVTLVGNGTRVVAITSAERLRVAGGAPLAIVTRLDGTARTAVGSWSMGRYTGLGLIELAEPLPADAEVVPLPIAQVHATIETGGAPAAIVAIAPDGAGFARVLVPAHIDVDDGGGMRDVPARLVRPVDAAVSHAFEGAPVFAWFPAQPALGRPSEVLAIAVLLPARARRPGVVGELLGLDDLGRVLLTPPPPAARAATLAEVAGEILDDSDQN